MTDLDQLSAALFIALVVLSIVIAVLGVSVWFRLSDAAGLPQGRKPLPATALALACVFAITLLSIHLPLLALLPAAGFCVKGLGLLRHRGVLNRDGGIVLLLVGVAWMVLAGIQATLLAWEKTIAGAPIRMDIVLTLPLVSMASILGWFLLDRLPVDPDLKPRRKPVSILGGP
ncbi:MAG TPA: hypothetical protein VL025_14395 [Thermoanaerobaculia bacterium]|nr:hypothetical protein [Thermoanaerobaculia bacterium]